MASAQACGVRAANGFEIELERHPDDTCEHLVVRDAATDEIAGSCKLVSPRDARRNGGYRLERQFDTALLIVLRERMVEVGPPCIHARYRFEDIANHLWSALARYLIVQRHDYVVAAASVSLLDGGHVAASIHRAACTRHLSPEDYRVFPRRRLALENFSATRSVAAPPLLKGYLDIGAWICGEPAHDAENDRAEFPLLLPLARMQGRDARRFLAHAV
jgi:putative hemolysin